MEAVQFNSTVITQRPGFVWDARIRMAPMGRSTSQCASLAAEAAGLKGHCSYDASTSGVQIDFEEMPPFRSPLFEAISGRQCSRVAYDGSHLSAEQLQQLEKAGQGDGVSIMLFTDIDQKEQIARYVAEGNSAQFRDNAWARELKSWIRFNGREAVVSGDGLYGPVMGSPDVPRWLGLLAMRFGFSAKKQNQKDDQNIRSSSAIAVLISDIDDKPHWIEAGRCYERLALQATALDLSTAFINQPDHQVFLTRQAFSHQKG